MLLEQKQPTARIAVKKNVLKLYSVNKQDVNYLPKDAEFEIELYNPLQETILAKLSLNNKELNGGRNYIKTRRKSIFRKIFKRR